MSDSRILRFRRDHGFLWGASLFLLGVAMLYASVALGVAVADVGRTATHCWSEGFGGPVTPDTCRAHGGTVAYGGGHTGLGVVIGLLGAFTMPWLVPLLVARPFRREAAIAAIAALESAAAEDALHGRPYPIAEGERITWDDAHQRWWTVHQEWWWRLDRGASAWCRGDVCPADRLWEHAVVGELALDGRVRPVGGTLALAEGARRHGLRRMLCAAESAAEAGLAGIEAMPVHHLAEAVAYLRGEESIEPAEPAALEDTLSDAPDLADVRGQERGRRALELAAAGGHNLLLVGPCPTHGRCERG